MIQTWTCLNCGYFWVLGLTEVNPFADGALLPVEGYCETCMRCRPDLDYSEADGRIIG